MSSQRTLKYTFRHVTGYIVAPWISGVGDEPVAIGHTAAVPPWTDPDIHLHSDSEEYYFLLQGELQLLVDASIFTLRPYEVLMVKANVPHAIVGGTESIEHFVLRMPAVEDRQTVGTLPAERSAWPEKAERELRVDWGCRMPLTDARSQNYWLFGVGQAPFLSKRTCLAYLNLPTPLSIQANPHQHRLHLHRGS
jgi:mannose-6-phosphate isomerase-like protein (cupin superfamily)